MLKQREPAPKFEQCCRGQPLDGRRGAAGSSFGSSEKTSAMEDGVIRKSLPPAELALPFAGFGSINSRHVQQSWPAAAPPKGVRILSQRNELSRLEHAMQLSGKLLFQGVPGFRDVEIKVTSHEVKEDVVPRATAVLELCKELTSIVRGTIDASDARTYVVTANDNVHGIGVNDGGSFQ